MADFTNPNASVANMAAGNPGINMGTTGSMRDVEGDLKSGWDKARGASASAWHDVKDAARDAWDHARGMSASTTARSTTIR